MERRRIRSAGAALSFSEGGGAGAALLGNRRRGQRVSLQQLSEPLPLAPSGPDGCSGRPAGGRAPLLRNRCTEHFSDLPALPVFARPRGPCTTGFRARARAGAAAQLGRITPRRFPQGLGGAVV